MVARTLELHAACSASAEERRAAEELVQRMDDLDVEAIIDRWLKPQANSDLADPNQPSDSPDTPGLLRVPPAVLLARLAELHPGHSITLGWPTCAPRTCWNCSTTAADSSPTWRSSTTRTGYGRCTDFERIIGLQQAINSRKRGAPQALDHLHPGGLEDSGLTDLASRREKLTAVLRNMAVLRSSYAKISCAPGWAPIPPVPPA
jgi:hypothetical protein